MAFERSLPEPVIQDRNAAIELAQIMGFCQWDRSGNGGFRSRRLSHFSHGAFPAIRARSLSMSPTGSSSISRNRLWLASSR